MFGNRALVAVTYISLATSLGFNVYGLLRSDTCAPPDVVESAGIFELAGVNEIGCPIEGALLDVPDTITPMTQALAAAKSSQTFDGKDEAMRIVAEQAIRRGDYDEAVDAGEGGAGNAAKTNVLSIVAQCAILDGNLPAALKATKKIPNRIVHDKTLVYVLDERGKQDSGFRPRADSDFMVGNCRYFLPLPITADT